MSPTCGFEALGDGRFAVTGVLDFDSVADLLVDSRRAFEREPKIEVDLAGVSSSDSAALALLIEWLRSARRRGAEIRFVGVPDQLVALARLSDLEPLLDGASGAGQEPSAADSSSSIHSSSRSSGSSGGSPS
jgi:phospholipid transport system transporter-binding protein